MQRLGNNFSRNLALVALAAASFSSLAAPTPSPATSTAAATAEADPIRRLLIEQGYLPATTATAVQAATPTVGGVAGPLQNASPATTVSAPASPAAVPGVPAASVSAAQADDAAPARPGLAAQVRDRASDMVLTAMNFLGVPYRRGGTSETSGFDCSGFTRHIFELSLGLVLPRRADEQARARGLIDIRRDELRPGDLVFFNTMRRTFSHVGIYVGEGKFIHSPRAGGKVRVEEMGQGYWKARFTGARRVDASLAGDLAPTAR